MGVDRALNAGAEQGGSPPQDEPARDLERDPVYRGGGLPTGPVAQGFSVLHDGTVRLPPAARRRRA